MYQVRSPSSYRKLLPFRTEILLRAFTADFQDLLSRNLGESSIRKKTVNVKSKKGIKQKYKVNSLQFAVISKVLPKNILEDEKGIKVRESNFLESFFQVCYEIITWLILRPALSPNPTINKEAQVIYILTLIVAIKSPNVLKQQHNKKAYFLLLLSDNTTIKAIPIIAPIDWIPLQRLSLKLSSQQKGPNYVAIVSYFTILGNSSIYCGE